MERDWKKEFEFPDYSDTRGYSIPASQHKLWRSWEEGGKEVLTVYPEEPYELDPEKVVKFIEEEKKKSRKEALGDVKKKFGGSVIIGMGDNGLGVTIKPELDVWLEEELNKLSSKENEG